MPEKVDLPPMPGFLRRGAELKKDLGLPPKPGFVHGPLWGLSSKKARRLSAVIRVALSRLGWTTHYRKGLTNETALGIIRRNEKPARKRKHAHV